MGLDGDTSKESVVAIQKQAMLSSFFDNSGEKDIDSHYYVEYSDAPIDVKN